MAIELPAQLQGIEFALPADNGLGMPQTPFQRRVATIEGQASLTGHLERAERELNAQAPAMDRALTGYGLLISAWMTRETQGDNGLALREGSHRLAEAFADAVEAQFRSGASVADYAKALGVTPTHLSRVCRDAAGRPALALLNERIIHEARRLLRDTDMPAREIAQTLGFSSAAYFTRAFQQAAGKTPIAYRQGR
jgi:AraC-like DNA-binding protein